MRGLRKLLKLLDFLSEPLGERPELLTLWVGFRPLPDVFEHEPTPDGLDPAPYVLAKPEKHIPAVIPARVQLEWSASLPDTVRAP